MTVMKCEEGRPTTIDLGLQSAIRSLRTMTWYISIAVDSNARGQETKTYIRGQIDLRVEKCKAPEYFEHEVNPADKIEQEEGNV